MSFDLGADTVLNPVHQRNTGVPQQCFSGVSYFFIYTSVGQCWRKRVVPMVKEIHQGIIEMLLLRSESAFWQSIQPILPRIQPFLPFLALSILVGPLSPFRTLPLIFALTR